MNDALKEITLGFFLTKGNSLASWDNVGQLDREVDYLNRMARHLKRIYLFSYGQDAKYQELFASNVRIISRSGRASSFVYQFLLPFKHRDILRQCTILKTNQLYAAVPAIVAKILWPKSRLVVRCGYIASLNADLYRYSFVKRWYTKCLEWLALRLANQVFIPTDENAARLRQKHPFASSKITVLNNAINTEVFRPIPKTPQYDIGYVGRLEKDKNLVNLLEAVKGLNVSLCFIGQGPEKDRLCDLARREHINLTIINRVENYRLPEYYNSFAIFVFPSLHEGNPKTLLEAMACGRPVIGCDVVGVKNIIQHNFRGILTMTDAESLKIAISKLLHNHLLMVKLGLNARNYIQQKYDFKVLLQKELRIYENILQ